MKQLQTQKRMNPLAIFLGNFESEHTRKAYLTDIIEFFRVVDVTDLQKISLDEFVVYKRYLDNRTSNTIRRKLSSVRSFFKWLYEQGHITSDPSQGLKLPKQKVTKATEALTDLEVRKLLNSITDKKDYAAIFLLLHLGLRSSELLKITSKDIYESDNMLIVAILGKGGKKREMPVSDFVRPILNEVKQSSVEDLPLFDITSVTLFRKIKKYAKKAGIKKNISAHSFRATAITKVIEQGAPITEVADFAGHTNISTTHIYWKRRKGLKNSPALKLAY